VQYLTEKELDPNYPTRRGPARNIVDYMKGDKTKMSPIMTNSESIFQFGNNAYGKPATALNILRETVMGRELFDYAFKEYCRRWAFKHPTPEDFFRTMEDASAVDLDWFWRGWFYGVDHCDMSVESVKLFRLNSHDPVVEKQMDRIKKSMLPEDISLMRDRKEGIKTQVEVDPDVRDFYTTFDPMKVTPTDLREYENFSKALTDEEKKWLSSGKLFYEVTVKNVGGLVMPLIFDFEFVDGSHQVMRIPAEIWKMSEPSVTKVFAFDQEVKRMKLDPFLETADVELQNNEWPVVLSPNKFELFKQQQNNWKPENPMQRALKEKEGDKK
jgi:hypothetical protein